MENEFVPYEQALDLKELGFDEPCLKGYTEQSKGLINFANTHTNTSVKNTLPTKPFTAPLYQQAFRWFRETYKLSGLIDIGTQEYSFFIFNESEDSREISSNINGSYEEAELECLKKLIEIVKNK